MERDLDLGYMGTHSDDRQPTVERLLLDPARRLPDNRFALVGPMYPDAVAWTPNVERVEHLPPAGHPRFYRRQRFTLNVTRQDMIAAGWAPSVRLFEAAACGTPVISDRWEGLGDVFAIGREILVADSTDDAVRILAETPENERAAIGAAACARVLREHTAAHRAAELEAGLLFRALTHHAVLRLCTETQRHRGTEMEQQAGGSSRCHAAEGRSFQPVRFPVRGD